MKLENISKVKAQTTFRHLRIRFFAARERVPAGLLFSQLQQREKNNSTFFLLMPCTLEARTVIKTS